MSEKHTVQYEGNPAFASALAQELRERGAQVDYTPPGEDRGAGQEVANVVLNMIAGGVTYDVVKAAVKAFLGRKLPGTKVEIKDENE